MSAQPNALNITQVLNDAWLDLGRSMTDFATDSGADTYRTLEELDAVVIYTKRVMGAHALMRALLGAFQVNTELNSMRVAFQIEGGGDGYDLQVLPFQDTSEDAQQHLQAAELHLLEEGRHPTFCDLILTGTREGFASFTVEVTRKDFHLGAANTPETSARFFASQVPELGVTNFIQAPAIGDVSARMRPKAR